MSTVDYIADIIAQREAESREIAEEIRRTVGTDVARWRYLLHVAKQAAAREARQFPQAEESRGCRA